MDHDSDFYIHEDIDDEQNDGEIINKREMKKAYQDLYAKSLVTTGVEIDHMLDIDALATFDL